jgi:hypothetical protein
MRPAFEILGLIGIGLSVAAYVPQMTHLAKEHCSAGVSPRAWTMWVASSALIGALAVYRADYVFILLGVTSLTSSAIILVLARRYRGQACSSHQPAVDPESVLP